MKSLLIVTMLTGVGVVGYAQNATQGEKIFKATCSACHTIGKGKLVGPDLMNVNSRRNEKWLLSFIKSSQKMVKGNDPVAVKLFNTHNKTIMPDQNLSDAQIKDILASIKSKSTIGTPAAVAKKGATVPATKTPATSSTQVKQGVPAKQTDVNAGKKKTTKVADNWIDAEYKIKCVASDHEINPKDLRASFWNDIKATELPLSAQNIAYPNLKKQSIDNIYVKSAYYKNQLVFFVEWFDSTKSSEVDADKFCDQFAIELPLNKDNIPSYMMGNSGGMVHIVHWKSIWQEDCEKGFQDVQVKYPNMWVDIYPGLESQLDRSKRIYAKDITSEDLVETHYVANMPGTYSQNPMSKIVRKVPVEEASAEGFGTLATQETQSGKGWAEWKNGKWIACIVVPINTGNIYKAAVKDKTKVAFAIWDGGYQNIGGRKHFIPWVDLYLENK